MCAEPAALREFSHQPVLPGQTLAALRVRPDGRYLDATYGRGGHAAAIAQALGPQGRLLLLDRDPQAVAHARRRFAGDPRVGIRQAPFSSLAEWDEVAAGVDGVLLDLGVSSPQLDDPERGFSFMADGPLDMRMDPGRGQSLAQWLAGAGEAEIADVWALRRGAVQRAIARAIVAARSREPIQRTGQLAELIAAVPGTRDRHKHPATRSFQALRIHINDES